MFAADFFRCSGAYFTSKGLADLLRRGRKLRIVLWNLMSSFVTGRKLNRLMGDPIGGRRARPPPSAKFPAKVLVKNALALSLKPLPSEVEILTPTWQYRHPEKIFHMFKKFINVKHTCIVEVPNRQCVSCLQSSLFGASNFSSEDVSSVRIPRDATCLYPIRPEAVWDASL